MIELLSIRKYNYDGVVVFVKIDFENNKVALVERDGQSGYSNKRYLFAGRELSYLNGWINVLSCMADAVRRARGDLEKYQKNLKKQRDDQIINTAIALAEMEEKKNG